MILRKLILFFILFATPCFGADDPKLVGYPPDKIMGFLGLDTSSKSPLLADGRAVDLQNVKISSAFDLQKREGYAIVNGTLDDLHDDAYAAVSSPAVTGIFDGRFSTTQRLFVFGGDWVKYNNAGTWSEITGTVSLTSNATYTWQCEQALDNGVCTNGNDVPILLNATPTRSMVNWSGLTNAPTKVKTLIWFQNYLILGNTTENSIARPTRFRWSNVGSITAWDNDNYIDIAELGGDSITAYAVLKGQLYAFLTEAIYRFSLVGGDDVFTSSKSIEGIGAVARDSVQNVNLKNNLGVIFLSKQKQVFFFDGYTVTDIGAIIQPTLDGLSETYLQYATSFYDDEKYCLSATSSGESQNDTVLCYNTEIGEWSKYKGINANAFERVLTSNKIKTYFGNYYSFVYWFDDPDKLNDVAGDQGIIDSVSVVSTATETNAQVLIDANLPDGLYTGATVRITSGTAQGEEAVILSMSDTSIIVTSAFTTTPDSTSNYAIGAIDSYYETKWYDFGTSQRNKLFRYLYFWSKEDTSNAVDVSYKIDFGSTMGSESVDLAPASASLWDTAIWDESLWGTTGDNFDTIDFGGRGRFINFKFSNDNIDETFDIYGYHILADALDVR